ncbi:hypothetical protein ACIQMJ_30760 [Actinosynnema sp. NPDC091369]
MSGPTAGPRPDLLPLPPELCLTVLRSGPAIHLLEPRDHCAEDDELIPAGR